MSTIFSPSPLVPCVPSGDLVKVLPVVGCDTVFGSGKRPVNRYKTVSRSAIRAATYTGPGWPGIFIDAATLANLALRAGLLFVPWQGRLEHL